MNGIQRHLRAAQGYIELRMFVEAADELERIAPEDPLGGPPLSTSLTKDQQSLLLHTSGVSLFVCPSHMNSNKEKQPSIFDSSALLPIFTVVYYLLLALGIYLYQAPTSIVNAVAWPLTAVLAGLCGLLGPLFGSPAPQGLAIAAITLLPYIALLFIIILWQKQRAAERQQFNQNLWNKAKLEADQRSLTNRIVELSKDTALRAGELDRVFLCSARENLEVAQQEFADGVINPFWEAIEETTRQLSTFEAAVTFIRNNVTSYRDMCRELGSVPCSIKGEIGESTFHRATDLARRLRSTVREAQKSATFATVYEQRRTTSAVYHGFSSLASAIQGMESRIVGSMEGLASTFQSSMRELQITQREAASDLADQVERLTGSLDSVDEGIRSGHETQEKTNKLLKDYIEEKKRH